MQRMLICCRARIEKLSWMKSFNINPQRSFPTIIIGDKIIIGFKEKRHQGGSGTLMTPAELYDLLKKAQEPKGYFFNKDKDWVLSILQDLLVNKERYGYTSCPCRLAAGRP